MAIAPASEDGFQGTVLQLAELLGWEWYHTQDSRRSKRGFPDLVLARERIVYAELKMPGKKPSVHQVHWHERIKAAGGEAYFWWPKDWAEIERTLGASA
jgi:hypothetical protein